MVIIALARYEFYLGLLQPIFVISRRHFSTPEHNQCATDLAIYIPNIGDVGFHVNLRATDLLKSANSLNQ